MTTIDQGLFERSVEECALATDTTHLKNRLNTISHEMTIISQMVNTILSKLETNKHDGYVHSHSPHPVPSKTVTQYKASQLYAQRRHRDKIFSSQLLGEACWDILLDLYSAAENGKEIAVTSACIASNVPPTTALRWLKVLEEHDLVERKDDVTDMRRHFIQLSTLGREKMELYFSTLKD